MENLINGVHHIALKAVDFDRSCAFYKDVLGFTQVLSWGEGDNRAAMLDCGGSCIELFAGGKGEVPCGGWYHLALRTSEPDKCFEAAVAAGCTPQIAPKDACIGGKPIRIAFVVGFNNEVIEFFKEC